MFVMITSGRLLFWTQIRVKSCSFLFLIGCTKHFWRVWVFWGPLLANPSVLPFIHCPCNLSRPSSNLRIRLSRFYNIPYNPIKRPRQQCVSPSHSAPWRPSSPGLLIATGDINWLTNILCTFLFKKGKKCIRWDRFQHWINPQLVLSIWGSEMGVESIETTLCVPGAVAHWCLFDSFLDQGAQWHRGITNTLSTFVLTPSLFCVIVAGENSIN